MLGRIFYSAALLLADPICAWLRKSAEGHKEKERAQKLGEAAFVQIAHVLSLQSLHTSMTAIFVLSCQSACVCVFAVLDTVGGLHSWYLFNQRTQHARATPLLAKGSKYRNDGREVWNYIKNPSHRSTSLGTGGNTAQQLKKLMSPDANANRQVRRQESPIPRRPATSPVRRL